ncbi:ATP-binding protein [Thalassococcus profundi]|uniref:ATP-binding protein n=1 Tax=Thalassococcus profundi TaxID=2282382 RepID=A0A369TLH7_9RHOB|nr:ATP-binding protein [Thalassococcus profundi]RDD65275.1 ATP-binding protein [Thalassococcus profundi]
MNDLINDPNAARLIVGLRDTGYNVKTAAADIIDNSIAAGANAVNINVELMHDGRKIVYFGDDGHGMTRDEVRNAMRYGADERADAKSLGKFGLGLKTASSSVCKRYSLISRKSPDQELAKLTWDLEHVEAQNIWEMLDDPVTPDQADLFEELCGDTGTLVVWENCDRILSKDYDPGSKEKAAIKRLAETLGKHVALVFHRFLDTSDERERNVTIRINDADVAAWNPFYPTRSDQVLAESKQRILVELPDGSEAEAGIKAWILPHRRDMTKEEEAKFARISNRAQGFYVYREGRLIQDGGWLDVFGAPEPHTSLLRIEFDFTHELDEAFRIDVKKSRILFHPELEDGLRGLLQPVYREAGNRYRRISRDDANKKATVDHGSSNKNIAATANVAKPQVASADPVSQTVEVNNKRGVKIRIKVPVQEHVNPESIYVEAVTTITSGHLFEPAYRSPGVSDHVPGVLLNKHHDFYQKIYQRAAASGYAVEGMDLLLYAFAMAEQNNTDPELEPVFEDIREEISSNLKKLLRNLPDPTSVELNEADEV